MVAVIGILLWWLQFIVSSVTLQWSFRVLVIPESNIPSSCGQKICDKVLAGVSILVPERPR